MNKIPARWPHQDITLEAALREDVLFDLSDAGTGKTRAAIDAFDRRGKRALVLAPKVLLESAWAEDIQKFAPHLKSSVAYAHNREEAFSVDADVYITNTDAVKWLAKQPKSFFDTFDTLIIDESSYYKNHTSQRSKAVKKISEHFRYRTLLTATPTSRSITDVWHQAFILDGGRRLGKSFKRFQAAVCKANYKMIPGGKEVIEWVDKPEARGAVADMLSDITVRHEFHVVMPDVPGNTEHYVYYKPSSKLMKHYEDLKEEAILLHEQGDVDAVNAAVLRTKLLQVAAGSVYGNAGKRLILDSQRAELVGELVYSREHSVVFYNWDHQREQLIAEFKKRKINYAEILSSTPGPDRSKIVSAYQDGQYQTLLMHPQTGAHGLTLTRGTATIWCSPTDRADLLVQGKHRVLRGGQTKETENIMVCARGTLERSVYDKTDNKRGSMSDLMEMLK